VWRRGLAIGLAIGGAFALAGAASIVHAPSGVPLARVGNAPVPTTAARNGRASLLLVGDTHFGESYLGATPQERTMRDRGYAHAFEELLPLARSADVLVANLETPLTQHRKSPLRFVKSYVHWGDPARTTDALGALGVGAVSLANNHSYDQLESGLEDTIGALAAHRIAAFGAGTTIDQAARPYRHDLALGRHTVKLAIVGTMLPDWSDIVLCPFARSTSGGVYRLAKRTLV
jgi:hypothetical protein